MTPPSDARSPRRPRAVFGPVRPVCWSALGEEHAAEFFAELSDRVEWIQWRYALDHRLIPHCWREHGPHLEELSALYTAWQNAYNISTDGDAPIRWIERFAAARQRMSEWTSRTGCRPNEHRRRTPPFDLGRRYERPRPSHVVLGARGRRSSRRR